jgi:hypothetical protein
MQATSSDISKNYSQQQQDEKQENTNDSLLNSTNPKASADGGKNDVSTTEKKSLNIPILVSKPTGEKSNIVLSEMKTRDMSGAASSPRGFKPIPRLPLPESQNNPQKSPRSPRSPRSDFVQDKKNSVQQSPSSDDVIKMADSVTDAYRSFGSPRKEQPQPRRLESRRGLEANLTDNTADTATTTTTTATTATTTTTTEPATPTIATTTSLSKETALVQIATATGNEINDGITSTDNSLILVDNLKKIGSASLPDEPGYQPGQIFVKVRRKISMPKILVPVSDMAVPLSSPQIHPVKYSKEAQMEVLADMLVADCAAHGVNPNDMGSLGRTDSPLDLDQLPPELREFKAKLKAKNKPASNHLMHALFWSEVESSEAWKKAVAIDHQFSRAGYGFSPRSGGFEGVDRNQLASMLSGFAENFTFILFKSPQTLQSLGMPEDFKKFLCIADQKFVIRLLDQDSCAAKGEKGAHPLSKRQIDQLRAFFLTHLLVTRFIQPMLVTPDRSQTAVALMLLKLEMKFMNRAALELSRDFQEKSFDKFPEDLQTKLIKKSEDELKIETINKRKNNLMEMNKKSSQRHVRSRSDLGLSTKVNPLEEKAKIERQKTNLRKQIDDQLSQIKGELGIKEFPSEIVKKIKAVKTSWFSVSEEVTSHKVLENLLKTVRSFIVDGSINKDLINFEEKLSKLCSESIEMRAKRRATMPVNLGDLEFLNAILDQTIDSNIYALSDDSPTISDATASTTTTTTNTTATTTTAKATTENSVASAVQTNSSEKANAATTPLTSSAEFKPTNILQDDQPQPNT